ncbi:MAG: hypothetical protein ACNA8W_15695, partial [Bradymonadaceae bacterium]
MRYLITATLCMGALLLFGACSEDHEDPHGPDVGAADIDLDVEMPDTADIWEELEDIDSGDLCPSERSTGESWCVDVQDRAFCTSSGEVQIERCSGDSLCDEGQCVAATVCEPGVTQGCAGIHSVLVCDAAGLETIAVDCPHERPVCIDGECTEPICEPSSVFCDGLRISECDKHGVEVDVLEICAEGCAQGACHFPNYENCGDGDDTSYCEFFAVQLSNSSVACRSQGIDIDLICTM